MPEITKEQIVQLRTKTGAGMMVCKEALTEASGDVEQAIAILRKRGMAIAAKRSGKQTSEGCVISYIHPGEKIGVLLEMNCETDFVSRTDDFRMLAKEFAMQVAAMHPRWVAPEDVPEDALAKEKEILKEQALKEGKPAQVVEKIITGRLDKFYELHCLLEQVYIRDSGGTLRMKDLLAQSISKIGENLRVRRFTRYQLGGE